MSINRVIISGNLTREPELRSTASGMAVLQLGVAVNDRVKNGDNWEDRPNYIDCTMFGSRAESVSRYLAKGSKVSIEGKLRWSQWEKDGQKRSKVEVVIDELEFMSAKKDEGQPQYQPAPQYQAPAYQPQAYQPQAYAPQPQAYAPQGQYQPAPQGYAPQQYPQGYQPSVAQQIATNAANVAAAVEQQTMYDSDIPF